MLDKIGFQFQDKKCLKPREKKVNEVQVNRAKKKQKTTYNFFLEYWTQKLDFIQKQTLKEKKFQLKNSKRR